MKRTSKCKRKGKNSAKYARNDLYNRSRQMRGEEHFSDNDSVFSDDSRSMDNAKITTRTHVDLIDQAKQLSNNKLHTKKFATDKQPSFLDQFEPMKYNTSGNPVSKNSAPNVTGNNAMTAKIQAERNLALAGGYSNASDLNEHMDYGVVSPDSNSFRHDNMVPFFSGATYGNNIDSERHRDTVKQRKVDTFTGSIKDVAWRPKTERKPLFNPFRDTPGYVYGMPQVSDKFQQYMIPGKERRNEYVVDQVRVTPGLNLGYDEDANFGFHDPTRIMPKTTNELRAANNPKITYEKPIIFGQKGTNRAVLPNVAKRKNETFKELDTGDILPSKAQWTAPTAYGETVAPTTQRQHTQHKTYINPSQQHSAQQGGYHATQPGMTAKHTHFETYANNSHQQAAHNHEATQGGYHAQQPGVTAKPTHRMTTQNNNYQQVAHHHESQQGGYHAQQPGTVAKNTHFETYANNTHQMGAKHHQAQQGGYQTAQPGTIAKPTHRMATQNKTYQNVAQHHESQQGGYQTAQTGTIAKPTHRIATQNRTYQNAAQHKNSMQGGYQTALPGTIAKPTHRMKTQNRTYQNAAQHKDSMQGGYHSAQLGMVAKPTHRMATQNKTYHNAVQHKDSMQGGYHTAQPGTIAKQTHRMATQNKTYQNVVKHKDSMQGGYHAAQPGTIAKPTHRMTTQNKTYQNAVKRHESQQGGYQNALLGTIAKPTHRMATQHKTHQNAIKHHVSQQGGYHAAQPGTVAKPTHRMATQYKTYQGPLGYALTEGMGYATNEKGTVAKATHRMATQDKTYQGPLGYTLTEGMGYATEEAGKVAKATHRMATQNKTYINPTGAHTSYLGGYGPEQAGKRAPVTLKDMVIDNTYQAPLGAVDAQLPKSRYAEKQMLQNVIKEVISQGRYPTQSNYEKGPSMDYTSVTLKDPIQINREVYGTAYNQRPLNIPVPKMTTMKNTLPQNGDHLAKHVMIDSIMNNPYINNTQHKAEYDEYNGVTIEDLMRSN
jgi:hypothetical protein